MIEASLQRYSAYRAACKFSAVFLAVIILLIGALGKLELVNLLWATAPLLCLGLLEAGYAVQERRYRELLREGKTDAASAALAPENAGASLVGLLSSIRSLSLWPFYLGLVGIIFAGGRVLPKPEVAAPAVAITSPPYRQSGSGPAGPGMNSRPLQVQGLPSHAQTQMRPSMTPSPRQGGAPAPPPVRRPALIPAPAGPTPAPPVAPASGEASRN